MNDAIVNLYTVSDLRSWIKGKDNIYIGRPSKWGNPYKVGTKVGTYSRQEAVSLYETYIKDSETLSVSIGALKEKILGCWCAPKVCHGQVASLIPILFPSLWMNTKTYHRRKKRSY